jgi:hypothetical protein
VSTAYAQTGDLFAWPRHGTPGGVIVTTIIVAKISFHTARPKKSFNEPTCSSYEAEFAGYEPFFSWLPRDEFGISRIRGVGFVSYVAAEPEATGGPPMTMHGQHPRGTIPVELTCYSKNHKNAYKRTALINLQMAPPVTYATCAAEERLQCDQARIRVRAMRDYIL